MRIVIDVGWFWDWVRLPEGQKVDDFYEWRPTEQRVFEFEGGPTQDFESPEAAAEWFADNPEQPLPDGFRLEDGVLEQYVTDENFKGDVQGEALIRTRVDMATHTTIVIPPIQNQRLIDSQHPNYTHITNLNEAIAHWVARQMANEAPREAWTAVHAHDGDHNEEVEQYLSAHFGVAAGGRTPVVTVRTTGGGGDGE